jgi:hypothetical protein
MIQTTTEVLATPGPPEIHVLPDPPNSSSAPAPQAIKKLSFGKIAVAKADTATTYPVFPDANGQAAIIAARIVERVEQMDVLEGALETDKEELRVMTNPHYFQVNHGRHDVPSSLAVNSPKGEVLVTYSSRCKQLPDEAPVTAILGPERTAKYFRQAYEFKLPGDKLPAAKAQAFIDELQELLNSYGCADALEVKTTIKPTDDFHAARHLELTTEENLAVDEACPIIVMVKTKGRKKK